MLSTRLAVLDLARRQQLTPDAYAALTQIAAGNPRRPFSAMILRRAVQALAMLLAGLGILFFIAANWRTQSPVPMFVGLEIALLGACLGAAYLTPVRVPLALLGFMASGTLLAFFGQYYQSSADPWQLFALWAGLLTPLAFATRSDIIWCAWIVVAMTAISTWLKGYTGSTGWRYGPEVIQAQMTAVLLTFSLCALMARPLRRFTGAADWALNLAVLLSVVLTTICGLWALFSSAAIMYVVGLLILACALAYFAHESAFDIRALSICALGIDSLIIGGSVKMVSNINSLGAMCFVVGLTILVTLALTVTPILNLYRSRTVRG